MKILIITSVFPYPLTSGGAQALFNMIDNLRFKHDIHLLFNQSGNNKISNMEQLQKKWPNVELIPYRYIRQLCYPQFLIDKAIRAFKLLFTPNNTHFKIERTLKPYGYYMSHDFTNFVNNIIKSRDINLVEVNFFPYLPIVNYLPSTIKKVFIHHEIRFVRNQRYLENIKLTNKEKKLMEDVRNDEISNLNKYDKIITLTEEDRKTLINNGVKKSIEVSPAAINSEISEYNKWNGELTFIGGYGHFPNKEGIDWFLDNVANKLNRNISLSIIGKGWPNEYEQRKTKIHLKGFVPALSSVAKDTIMIVPILTGSGMRMKILEAAAMGIPFITTKVGVEGLLFQNDVSCLIADTPDDFAVSLEKLMSDEELRRKLTSNASKIYLDNYSSKALSAIRNNIIESV